MESRTTDPKMGITHASAVVIDVSTMISRRASGRWAPDGLGGGI